MKKKTIILSFTLLVPFTTQTINDESKAPREEEPIATVHPSDIVNLLEQVEELAENTEYLNGQITALETLLQENNRLMHKMEEQFNFRIAQEHEYDKTLYAQLIQLIILLLDISLERREYLEQLNHINKLIAILQDKGDAHNELIKKLSQIVAYLQDKEDEGIQKIYELQQIFHT